MTSCRRASCRPGARSARFDPERPFEAWLRRIALNKCRDRARRNAVRRAAIAVLGIGVAPDESVDAGGGSATIMSHALQRLEAGIARLPRPLKEALVLTALEGLSHKEAGDLLGINVKAVETRVYRARKRLARMLDPEDLADITGPE